MIIDLSEWKEYIADDVPPGSIPVGVRVEFVQVMTGVGIRHPNELDYPSGLTADLDTVKARTFWRVLE